MIVCTTSESDLNKLLWQKIVVPLVTFQKGMFGSRTDSTETTNLLTRGAFAHSEKGSTSFSKWQGAKTGSVHE